MFVQLSHDLHLFCKRAPALEISLYLVLGSGVIHLSLFCFLCLCALFLWIRAYGFANKQRLHIALYGTLCVCMGGIYSGYFQPLVLKDSVSGNAVIRITDKRLSTFFGKTSIYYKLKVLAWDPEERLSLDHPKECVCFLKPQKELSAHCDYYVQNVTLTPHPKGLDRLKVYPHSLCIPLDHTSSIVEWRYQYKLKAYNHLSDYIEDTRVLKFLSALSLGYLDHKTLGFEFSRGGLQHLLTISGFHFALLALFFSLLLKPLLPKKLRSCVVLILLTAYVLYLGPAPSVSRAWIAIVIYLLAEIVEIKASALNNLGVAAIVAFIENPTSTTQIGFQLSYAATLGIVAFYTQCETWLRFLIPARPLSITVQMPLYEQLLYYVLVLLRKGLAVDVAVNIMTTPLLLYHFGCFPLFSFFYNLFVPCLVGGTLFLLLLGFSCALWPPLCSAIHHINELYTGEILSFVAHIPKGLDLMVFVPHVSCDVAASALCVLFFCCLYGTAAQEKPYGIFKLTTAGARRA